MLKAILLCGLWTLVHAQFPGPAGGCPTFPDPKRLPSLNSLMSLPGTKLAFSQIDQMIETMMEQKMAPSLTLGVVYQQEVVWFKGYGVFNSSIGKAPPNQDTVYRTGSIGKLFTTLLTMVARDHGLISLDEPISNVNPKFTMKNPFDASSRGVTFQQLASHMAGIASNEPLRLDNVTNDQAFALLANLTLIAPPDSIPLYSNLGFEILGNVVAEAMGYASYDKALQDFVFDPLGLSSSSVRYNSSKFDGRMAECWQGSKLTPAECLEDGGWTNPDGAHYSTTRDLMELIKLFFRQSGGRGGKQIVEGQTIRGMMLPRYIYPDRRSGFATPFELYWNYNDLLLHTKRGDIAGYSTEMIMSLPMQLGMIALCGEVEQANKFAQVAADILYPAFLAGINGLQVPMHVPPNWKVLLGTYANSEATATISGDANGLYFTCPQLSSGLLQWSTTDASFQLLPAPGNQNDCFITGIDQVLYSWIIFDDLSSPTRLTIPAQLGWRRPLVRV